MGLPLYLADGTYHMVNPRTAVLLTTPGTALTGVPHASPFTELRTLYRNL